jgi:hypothetical protein
MKCKDIQERLMLYLGEELPPDESGRIHEHLENCLACRYVLDDQRATDLLIRREVSRTGAPVFNYRKRSGYSYLAAAAAILLIAVTLLIFSRKENTGTDLTWDNGDMEELITLTNDLDQIDKMATRVPERQIISPEFISIESSVSYLEQEIN